MSHRIKTNVFVCTWLLLFCACALGGDFETSIEPVLRKYCIDCHSTKLQEGELDLEPFANGAITTNDSKVWERVLEQVTDGEMPPKQSPQMPASLSSEFTKSVQEMLNRLAMMNAGDPGDVVMRRLSNTEYTYTLQDLTGIPTLEPAREFPVDGAAGEGFTNAGAALVMSPSYLTKYLDAAKDIARHTVLLPSGIRFSPSQSRRDWTNESLAEIRQFYQQFTSKLNAKVPVDGTGAVSNDGGRIPLENYLNALDQHRDSIADGTLPLANVARENHLSEKYLQLLWGMLHDQQPSLILDLLRTKWQNRELSAADIQAWQSTLWRFTNIGHLGKVDGPKSWMDTVTPLAASQEFRVKLAAPTNGKDVVVYLAAGDAGDGNENDYVLWQKPRLVMAGRPDIPLKDLRGVLVRMNQLRDSIASTAPQCLAAVHEAQMASEPIPVAELAKKYVVDPELLQGWLAYLGVHATNQVSIGKLLSNKTESVSNYGFIQGWSGEEAYSVFANNSDATVQIPGTMKPFSIATHPSPTLSSVTGWLCPQAANVTLSGSVQDAHTACGNGVTWAIEIRRGNTRESIASGRTNGDQLSSFGPFENVSVRPGDMVTLVIGPGNRDHVCDLTAISLNIKSPENEWDLQKDVVPNILEGNPHADQYGNPKVWTFFGEPETNDVSLAIPSESLLAKWRRTANPVERTQLAIQVQQLLQKDFDTIPSDSPDRTVCAQLLSFTGPLLASAWQSPQVETDIPADFPYGIDPDWFGKHPGGASIVPDSLCVRAPSTIELRMPLDWVQGAELVVEGRLHESAGEQGSVQMQVLTNRPAADGPQPSSYNSEKLAGAWTTSVPSMAFQAPILVHEHSAARTRLEKAFDDFRQLFPAAVCYTSIVPVDEVVTLTLFHREDEPLMRLMLNDDQRVTLDRLWAELHFVSQDALTLVDAFLQIWEYSTQDGPNAPFGDKRLEPLRDPIMQGAQNFKQFQVSVEPVHIDAVVRFSERAWRRPLTGQEEKSIRDLYRTLRNKDVDHEEAIRLMLARVLASPAFLYRGEVSKQNAKSMPVSDLELATRLSYFLWSSVPDEELISAATRGQLRSPEVLMAQTQRMLRDGKIRRLATEFGCQWLHIRDLETLNEKSERHFPTFNDLRDDMQEEAVLFFTDMFAADRSVLSLLQADHSFMNKELATHYGIDLQTDGWQRVDGLQAKGRGGMLGFAATLAKQSGASRTSPILRGNWISEVVLGDKLPKPPKDVPILPDEAPVGLTERQMIERHSSDPKCASCHKRIDHFGFALEGFDAIGRARYEDAAGQKIDTLATLPGGGDLNGLDGLRSYLANQRQDDFLRQFCRKLLGYALGRSIQLSDKPLVDEMLIQLKSNDYRVHVVIEMLVLSPQFQQLRGRE